MTEFCRKLNPVHFHNNLKRTVQPIKPSAPYLQNPMKTLAHHSLMKPDPNMNHANKAIKAIKRYLQRFNSGSAEQFFLANGVEMFWRPFPQTFKSGRAKHCYGNAYQLSLQHGLIYCEGVAIHGFPIPVSHAWCIDKEGFVVDPTWKDPAPEEKRTYFGVSFKPSFVQKMKGKRSADSITDDGMGRCPINSCSASAWECSQQGRQS